MTTNARPTRPLPRASTEPGIPQTIKDIYDVVGGNRAMAMAFFGWRYNSSDPTSALFDVAPALRRQTRDGITHVRVTIDQASDLYRVELLRVSRDFPAGREVAALAGLQADSVRAFIESRTGLQLSLGTLGARRG